MKRFQNILVGVDTRFDTHPALRCAARIAEHNQARLKIVDVVPEFSWLAKLAIPDAAQTHEVLANEKARSLEELAAPLRDQGIDISTKVLFGKTSIEIAQEVIRSQHDLVIRVTKGAHSRKSGFFGTTSRRLIRTCPCALWLVRPDVEPRYTRILAAINPAPDNVVADQLNRAIMELGQSIAKYENGNLQVVHAWEIFNAKMIESRFMPGEFEKVEQKAEAEVAAVVDKFLLPFQLSHQDDCVHLIRDEMGAGTQFRPSRSN